MNGTDAETRDARAGVSEEILGRLAPLLAVRGVAGSDCRIELLAGGWWNRLARVTGAGLDWVVKVYADGSSSTLFPILPHSEAHALELLAGRELAPAIVAFLSDEPCTLVYEHCPGAAWSAGVEPVARLLRRCHALAAEGFREVPVDAAGILEQGAGLLASAPPAPELVRSRPSAFAVERGPSSLVHTDCGPSNLIDGPAGVRLIDWQCPASGDACEDVYAFLSSPFQILSGCAPLAESERRAFLNAYGDPAMERRLAGLWPALAWRMAAYCHVRRGDLAGVDPAGAERYERALSAALAEREPAA